MVLRRSLLLLIALLLPTIAFATTTYVVKKGDNLYDLSRKYGVSVEDIKKFNKLDSVNLNIGDELLIPNSNKDGNNKYVVKSGDTLSQIAEKLGVRTKDLRAANNLKNDKLSIGQTLLIPSSKNNSNEVVAKKAVAPEKAQPASPAKTEITTGTYTVKSGDTLGHIAEAHKVKTAVLKKANNLKNNNLQIGQKLVIPNSSDVIEVRKVKQSTSETAPEVKHPKRDSGNTNMTVSNVYIVNQGDTIYEISNRLNLSKNDLKKYNNLESNYLKIGQELYLTPNKKMLTVSERAEKKLKSKYTSEYKVKSGDTLGHIAAKHKTSVSDLKKANNLKNSNLSIGKVLKVPAVAKKDKAVANKTTQQKTSRTKNTKYIVKRGDTLSVIADKYDVSVAKIKDASALKNNKIKVGDVLLIPGTHIVAVSKPIPAKKVSKPKTSRPSGAKYSVVTGDTLGKIANQFGVSVSELKKANNLKKNDLYVGMKLVIPGKTSIKPISTQTAKKSSTQNKSNGSANTVPADMKIKQDIIKTAVQYLGVPYKFGGNSLKYGIDCSAYVKKIFGKYNIDLPRTARDIYWHAGTKVAKSQLQTGDLVFFTTYAKFPSHVGIYMGNGQFIHASSGARKVSITSLNKKYYQKRYIGAKRIPVSAVFEKEYSQK
ncbi:MAG: LysM peptidoglycan-binding domain-containing protein [Thermodesulfobacteriota bacterium]